MSSSEHRTQKKRTCYRIWKKVAELLHFTNLYSAICNSIQNPIKCMKNDIKPTRIDFHQRWWWLRSIFCLAKENCNRKRKKQKRRRRKNEWFRNYNESKCNDSTCSFIYGIWVERKWKAKGNQIHIALFISIVLVLSSIQPLSFIYSSQICWKTFVRYQKSFHIELWNVLYNNTPSVFPFDSFGLWTVDFRLSFIVFIWL